jgi:hypothetical protein
MVRDLQGALEEGLRVIDASVPCHPAGEIDLLALDRTNQLTIIDLDTAANDGLLLRGMGHLDWLIHNIPNVQRMHVAQTIHSPAQPRLFLLAPQFSHLFRCAVNHITDRRIVLVRYHVVEVSGTLGVFFERVGEE